MRIAHVLDTLEMGGAERVVVTLGALQVQQGHDVEVHYLFASGPLEAEFRSVGITVHSAAAGSSAKIIGSLTRNFRSTKPDVAHFHNATATIYGTIAALRAGVPARISTRHGLTPASGDKLREGKFWLAACFCQSVVAVSSQAERNMRGYPFSISSKISLIINGCSPAKCLGQGPVRREDLFTFIHVARLNKVKAQDILLQAFAHALEQSPNLRLLVVGDGPLRSQLEQMAAGLGIAAKVDFAGERDNVGDWLVASNCFVLSSLTEGTPMSLLEALAAGLPSIVTNVGEMPLIIQRSECGWVVPPGSSQELGQAMVLAATLSSEELVCLRHNAWREYETHFQPEIMAAGYMVIYQRSLDRQTAHNS